MNLPAFGPRYICQRCVQRLAAPRFRNPQFQQWRKFSTAPTSYEKHRPRGPRRFVKRRNGEADLESSAKTGTAGKESEGQIYSEDISQNKDLEDGTNAGIPAEDPGSTVKPNRLAQESAVAESSQAQPSDVNMYWATYPPTNEECLRAKRYFTTDRAEPNLLISTEYFRQIPNSDIPEVVFVGRSNVGKSSLLNAVVGANIKDLLARTSRRPGFTRTMNFYGIGPGSGVRMGKDEKNHKKFVGLGGLVIVDMPGYGEGSLREWGVEIMKYVQDRKQLRRVFVLIDASTGLKDKDRALLASLRLAGVSHQIIVSRLDKLFIPKVNNDEWKGKGVAEVPPRARAGRGSLEGCLRMMGEIKDEIAPEDTDSSGNMLGELLACSSDGGSYKGRIPFGIDEVRYAVLKAVGRETGKLKPSRPGKRARDMAKKVAALAVAEDEKQQPKEHEQDALEDYEQELDEIQQAKKYSSQRNMTKNFVRQRGRTGSKFSKRR